MPCQNQVLVGMAQGDVMTLAIPAVAAGATTGSIQVTPLTAMAQAMAQGMPGGMTDANIVAANTAMGNYFSVADIVHVRPMNPLLPGSGAGATQDAGNYGMTLAAMSQYAKTLGMANSSALVTAMMGDASDRVMDGKRSGNPIAMPMGGMMGSGMMAPAAGTSGLGAAMASFMNSAANASGMTAAEMAALIPKLTSLPRPLSYSARYSPSCPENGLADCSAGNPVRNSESCLALFGQQFRGLSGEELGELLGKLR